MATSEELRIILRTVAETRGADQVRRSLGQVRQDAAGAGRTVGLFGREGTTEMIRFASSLVGVNLGLSLAAGTADTFRQVLADSVNVTREHERVVRATAAAYGQNAAAFQRFAAALEEQTGFTSDAILEASLSARTLSTNYGLTIAQTQKLITVSADLARVRGIGVAEAFERVQSAIRGEAEASEFLGLTLNATFLQQHAANGAFKDTFTTLTDTQRAQVVYGEVLKQTAAFSGLASSSTNSLDAAFDKAAVSGRKLQLILGEMIKPVAVTGLRDMSESFRVIGQVLSAISKLPAGILFTPFAAGAIGGGFVNQRNAEERATRDAAQAERDLRHVREINENLPPVTDPSIEFRRQQAERDRADQQNRRLREINELPSRDTAAELQRLAFLDQRDAATRDLILSQQELNNLQRQAVQLSAEEAQIRLRLLPAERALAEVQRQQAERQIAARLASLPATEALEDFQFAQQRARLTAANRNASPDDRRAARRELRDLARAEPGVELNALTAQRGITEASRVETRLNLQVQLQQLALARQVDGIEAQQEANRLLQSINRAAEQTAQQRLEDTIAQAIQNGIERISELPVRVTVNITQPDGTTRVIEQLIEATGQAQTPPIIQLSGVR